MPAKSRDDLRDYVISPNGFNAQSVMDQLEGILNSLDSISEKNVWTIQVGICISQAIDIMKSNINL